MHRCWLLGLGLAVGCPTTVTSSDGAAPDAPSDAGDRADGVAAADSARMDASPPACAALPALRLLPLVDAQPWTRPVDLVQPNGTDDLYVVDSRGLVFLVRDGRVLTEPFLDVRAMVGALNSPGDERGLLSLAFHPSYATNGRFFVGITPVGGPNIVAEGRRSAVPERAEAGLTTLVSESDPAANHNGGHVLFGPDGYLYAAFGDGGGAGDPFRTAQDVGSLLGKILRLDVSSPGVATAPPSNPFVDVVGARPEVWALGLRNPWRMAFGPAGELFIADVGQNLWEEVNVQPPGRGGLNYGWSNREGFHAFAGATLRPGDTATDPVLEVLHESEEAVLRSACSITGGVVVGPGGPTEYEGAYLFGDYCSTDLAVLRRCASEWVATRLDVGEPVAGVVSFGLDRTGAVYVLTLSPPSVRRLVR